MITIPSTTTVTLQGSSLVVALVNLASKPLDLAKLQNRVAFLRADIATATHAGGRTPDDVLAAAQKVASFLVSGYVAPPSGINVMDFVNALVDAPTVLSGLLDDVFTANSIS